MRHDTRCSSLAAAMLATLGAVPFTAQAATVVVSTTGDSGAATDCSLRQAIVSINAGAVAGTGCSASGSFGTGDTINFDTTAFPNGGPNTITLTSGQLSITAPYLTIDAANNGNVTIDANHASRVMYANAASGSLTLNHLTLRNGKVVDSSCFSGGGGGICIPMSMNLTVVHSTLSGNSAGSGVGGGISSGGGVTLTNSTLSGNSAGEGGGILTAVFSGSGHYMVLTNSTLSGNSAASGGGISLHGGGVTLTNSTLSGNSATGLGGGIYMFTSVATLTSSTLSGNSAGNYGGGIFSTGPSAATIVNSSIIAGNTQPNGGEVNPGVSSSSSNNLIGVDPMLGALANNGGPTLTMLPLAGSPVINAAPCLAQIATDQRGMIRPDPSSANLATPCDIGAVEANSIPDEIFANGFEP